MAASAPLAPRLTWPSRDLWCARCSAEPGPLRDQAWRSTQGGRPDDTPTSLRDLYGIGPVTTALVLGEVIDVARFRNRDHFASYNGTAPTDRGSAGNPNPAVNLKGNRKLNHAIHVVAITQIRNPKNAGRGLYERKLTEGKTRRPRPR